MVNDEMEIIQSRTQSLNENVTSLPLFDLLKQQITSNITSQRDELQKKLSDAERLVGQVQDEVKLFEEKNWGPQRRIEDAKQMARIAR